MTANRSTSHPSRSTKATKYAAGTSVTPERTKAAIESLLQRHGATTTITGYDAETRQAVVQFKMRGRSVRLVLTLPDQRDAAFTRTERGRARTASAAAEAHAQEVRRRWRALLLVLTAKLAAVEDGITTFEAEFLSHLVLTDGRTVGSVVVPQIEAGTLALAAGDPS